MASNLNLRERRLELGLSQAYVAKAVGVSESTISRWESGNIANMKRPYIVAYARALHVSPADIIGDPSGNSRSEPVSPPLPASLAFKLARLDETDQAKVEAYTDGLLDQDKYKTVSSAG